jgi:hypothetical protein
MERGKLLGYEGKPRLFQTQCLRLISASLFIQWHRLNRKNTRLRLGDKLLQ